jgi:hypothetical protein
MSQSYRLYDFISSFHTPLVRQVTVPKHNQEACYVCLRKFGAVDEPSEPPCFAMEFPCGHCIGSVCIEDIRWQDSATCPLCRQVVAFAPSLLSKIAGSAYIAAQIRRAGVCENGSLIRAQFERLCPKLKNGQLGFIDAFILWLCYLGTTLAEHLALGVYFAAANLGCMVLEYAVGRSYIEVLLVPIIFGDCDNVTVAFVTELVVLCSYMCYLGVYLPEEGDQIPQFLIMFATFQLQRFVWLLLGWRTTFVFIFINYFILAIVMGVLIISAPISRLRGLDSKDNHAL